jgi:carbon storage regulator
MLVLTRRCNEVVVIGENISVTVLGVDRGVVRLGILAPPDVNIVRQELLANVAFPRPAADRPTEPPF